MRSKLIAEMHSPTDSFVTAAIAAGAAVIVFISYGIWSHKYGLEAVKRWAQAKGLEIVKAKRRSFAPHWRLKSGKGYQFFRVTVRDRGGANHQAWLRCFDSGCTEPNTVEVVWDKDTNSA